MRAAATCVTLATLALAGCSGGSSSSPQPAPAPQPLAVPAIDPAMMIRAASGLMYRDVVEGTGTVLARGMNVDVHYVGQLPNGSVFDALQPGQTPLRFRLGQGRVIRGWDEGLVGMKVGGRRLLVIPPELGYGSRGVGPIPPNATLVFLIEVVSAS